MEKVCMYLRKSRVDLEKEKLGEMETLSRHKASLMKVAKEQGLDIIRIREEIVSGESIIHRPEMLELLKEVESGLYNAVLCMDVDRLGRGNMQEQGLILQTFKKGKTKIITPRKTYDLMDEFDEEYSEFEAFMARKELKLINRRLQRGRLRSIEEGNYIGTVSPYGYDIHYIGKVRTLQPNPEQVEVVRMIFDMYVNKAIGSKKIANKLNELGYKTYTGIDWSGSAVLSVIKNPVYTGKVVWKKKQYKKSSKPNQIKEVSQNPVSEWIIADGKHEGLISDELYDMAQKQLKTKYHIPYNMKVTNPLAGLIRCKVCGASMVYRPYTRGSAHITCYNNCGNKSTKFEYIEGQILLDLRDWLDQYRRLIGELAQKDQPQREFISDYQSALKKVNKELSEAEAQKQKLHDFLEQGIYDIETYLSRSKMLVDRMDSLTQAILNLEEEIVLQIEKEKAKEDIIPQIEEVLKLYPMAENAEQKNNLLKLVIEKVEYYKAKDWKNDYFELVLYPLT